MSFRRLIKAIERGDYDRVYSELKKGTDIHRADYYSSDVPLREAVIHGQEAIVRLLLDPRKYGLKIDGANIHAGNDLSLIIAAQSGHVGTVHLLLNPRRYGLDLDGCNRNILTQRHPQMLIKIEQYELYDKARILYYSLVFAQQHQYSKGQCGSLIQALGMTL